MLNASKTGLLRLSIRWLGVRIGVGFLSGRHHGCDGIHIVYTLSSATFPLFLRYLSNAEILWRGFILLPFSLYTSFTSIPPPPPGRPLLTTPFYNPQPQNLARMAEIMGYTPVGSEGSENALVMLRIFFVCPTLFGVLPPLGFGVNLG